MLLAIDAGNTQTVIGLFDGKALADHWRIATVAERTADELALMIQQFLAFHGFRGFVVDPPAGGPPPGSPSTHDSPIGGVVISSGVPRVTAELREMTARYFGFPALVLEPGVRTGMPILYDNPKEVGPDRIANAVAAYDLYGGPSIVVDFGTANTIEAISEHGEYLGGAIFPGIEISMDALFGRAAALRRVELVAPRARDRQVHRRSRSSRAACTGTAARSTALVDRFQAELGDCTVVATGGLADPIVHALPHRPALRAVADPPGPAHRLRAQPMTAPPPPGGARMTGDGYLGDERARRLAKLDALRAARRPTRTRCASTAPTPLAELHEDWDAPRAGRRDRRLRSGSRAGCCSSAARGS